jgi:hypothetical protein
MKVLSGHFPRNNRGEPRRLSVYAISSLNMNRATTEHRCDVAAALACRGLYQDPQRVNNKVYVGTKVYSVVADCHSPAETRMVIIVTRIYCLLLIIS